MWSLKLADLSYGEALALLRLQIAWGADEALDDLPRDRLASVAPPIPPPPPPPPRPMAVAQRSAQARAAAVAAAADSLERLREAVLAFDGCPLRDTASHTLFAEGDPGCGLMLIGEVPDAEEDRAGRLFAGAAGELLDRMLASIDLSRDEMLIAPLIPWRPPGDRRVSPLEMATCLPFLHRLLALARPRHLVLMGVRPARALLATESPLSRLRGRWIPPAGGPATSGLEAPALAMHHPSQLLANPAARKEGARKEGARKEAWADLLLLRVTLSQAGETNPPESR